ncbi:hypothetical protein O3G_MSEX001320 [Manduca sexta]|uniref:Uncharacterized protein n=1 Tax=Manduca sexta TaxID=7130 RepID=A0A921YJR7_MANSE|nr:hypothetical protein O3G_MSEX001320 [Manduca sexta]
MPKLDEDKGIVYCNRVRVGNWYESTKLEEYKLNKFLEQMKKGDLMLARFRKMTENLNKPTVLTQSSGSIGFGARISLLAPHVPDYPKGIYYLIRSNRVRDIKKSMTNTGETTLLGFTKNLIFLKEQYMCLPLYIRYDPNPIPGLCGKFPLYLSEHFVSNTRWRLSPVQKPGITRFEQEGHPITVNADLIINHCATNINLGINVGVWAMGFYGKICAPVMKTYLDVYGRELPNNIWQIYTPIAS